MIISEKERGRKKEKRKEKRERKEEKVERQRKEKRKEQDSLFWNINGYRLTYNNLYRIKKGVEQPLQNLRTNPMYCTKIKNLKKTRHSIDLKPSVEYFVEEFVPPEFLT